MAWSTTGNQPSQSTSGNYFAPVQIGIHTPYLSIIPRRKQTKYSLKNNDKKFIFPTKTIICSLIYDKQIHSGLKGSCLWVHLPPGWSSKRSSKDSEHPLHSISKCYYFTYRLNSYNWFPASHRAHDLLFIIRVFLRHKLDCTISVPAPSGP